jgi:hypothetical protein
MEEKKVLDQALNYLRSIFALRKASTDLMLEMVDMNSLKKKVEAEGSTLEKWLEDELRGLMIKIFEVKI